MKLRFALCLSQCRQQAPEYHTHQLWCAERALSAEEAEKQRAEVRQNWDFSVILDCLEVFEEEIDLQSTPHIERLEDALVESTGAGPCLLAEVHLVRHPHTNRSMRSIHCSAFLQKPACSQTLACIAHVEAAAACC